MTTKELVQQIISFRSEEYPVVSFYLNIDVEQQSSGAYKISAKDLTKQVKEWMKQHENELTREVINSLNQDIDKFLTAVNSLPIPNSARGYVVFTCSGEGFWQELFLPAPVKSLVRIGVDPFVRILTNILDQYKRYGLVIIDRSRVVAAEVYMNEVIAMEEASDEVPKKVRYGGWRGYDEARIKRHVGEHIFEHLKNAAIFVDEFFKARPIDRLILSGTPELLGEFESLLPEVLARKVIARRTSDVHTNNKKDILAIVKEVEDSLRATEEKEIVDRIINERNKNGNAAIGLYEVIRALHANAIQTLVVAEGYAEKGFRCLGCHYLSTNEEKCPVCEKPMNPEEDIIDELIEEAFMKRADVRHIHHTELFPKIKNIAALLRFKIPL